MLFYRALLLDAGPDGLRPVLLGIGLSVAILVALVLIVGRLGRKLNPRPVMLASSVLLAVLGVADRSRRALAARGRLSAHVDADLRRRDMVGYLDAGHLSDVAGPAGSAGGHRAAHRSQCAFAARGGGQERPGPGGTAQPSQA